MDHSNILTLTTEESYFLDLLASMVNEDSFVPNAPHDLNWGIFYSLCQRHNLSGMVSVGLKRSSQTVPEPVASRFAKDYETNVFYEVKRRLEIETIFDQFENRKIDYLPLKGYVIRDFYPSPEWRTMGDVDILVRKKDLKKAESTLIEEGFSREGHNERHSCFKKLPLCFIELHHLFYHPRAGSFRVGFPKFYQNEEVWKRLEKRGDGCRYNANRLDLFLMFFLHLVKHFLSGGVGVRYILDYQVIKKHFSISLDEPEIKARLKELSLQNFVQNIDRLSSVWFDHVAGDKITSKLGHFILTGNVHGQMTDLPVIRLAAKSEHKKKLVKTRFILGLLFPRKNVMLESYPLLKRHFYCLPLCYAHWIVSHTFKVKNWRHYYRLFMSLFRIQRDEMGKTREFLREVGLGYVQKNG